MRYPYRHRPDQHRICVKPESKALSEVEKLPELSPALMCLLSITAKDGFVHSTAFSLLKDIYPYVSLNDRRVIERVLGYGNTAKKLSLYAAARPLIPHSPKRVLTSQEKFLRLLRTLSRYSGQNARRIFAQLENYMSFRGRVSSLREKGFTAENLPDFADLFTGGHSTERYEEHKTDSPGLPHRPVNPPFTPASNKGNGMNSLGPLMGILQALSGRGGSALSGSPPDIAPMLGMLQAFNGKSGSPGNPGQFDINTMLSILKNFGGNGGASSQTGQFDVNTMLNTLKNFSPNNMSGQLGSLLNGSIDNSLPSGLEDDMTDSSQNNPPSSLIAPLETSESESTTPVSSSSIGASNSINKNTSYINNYGGNRNMQTRRNHRPTHSSIQNQNMSGDTKNMPASSPGGSNKSTTKITVPVTATKNASSHQSRTQSAAGRNTARASNSRNVQTVETVNKSVPHTHSGGNRNMHTAAQPGSENKSTPTNAGHEARSAQPNSSRPRNPRGRT